MGNVDAKVGIFMIVALLGGVYTAVQINSSLKASLGQSASDLYISVVFVGILSSLVLILVRDLRSARKKESPKGITSDLAIKIKRIKIPPMVTFKSAGVISIWFVLLTGYATGFLAGTIGVGGFIGVPAMIYVLGMPVTVAAGTELFLAIFSGFEGSFLYAMQGLVDLRLVLLLYVGSILGVHIGAIATKIVDENRIKFVLAIIIALATLSRVFAMPEYLQGLGYAFFGSHQLTSVLTTVSSVILFGSAFAGAAIILASMWKASRKTIVFPEHGLLSGAEE